MVDSTVRRFQDVIATFTQASMENAGDPITWDWWITYDKETHKLYLMWRDEATRENIPVAELAIDDTTVRRLA